jgi:hypothetical protein
MKKQLSVLALIALLFISCNSNSLKDRKLYVFNCELKGYIASIQEVELNFISDTHLEARKTLYASLGDVSTYKSNPRMYEESKIFSYSYEGNADDGVVTIDDLNLTFRLTRYSGGVIRTNQRDAFYQTSIVDILKTEEAVTRIRQTSPSSALVKMYVDLLNGHSKKETKRRKKQQEEEQSKEYYGE